MRPCSLRFTLAATCCEEGVLAESGLSLKTPAAVGTSEQAHRQRQRVTKREGGIMRDLGQELLPEALLDLPEVGRLPGQGGAIYPHQVREEVNVVAPEVGEELRILVESQELTDDLYGEHFGVAQRWGGSTLSEAPEVSDAVVDEAEDGDDEGVKIHKRKRPPLRLSGAIGQHRA